MVFGQLLVSLLAGAALKDNVVLMLGSLQVRFRSRLCSPKDSELVRDTKLSMCGPPALSDVTITA